MTTSDGNSDIQSLMRIASLQSSHTSRTFHNEGSGYMIPQDDIERARLQLQHHIIRKAFDGKIALVPITLNSGSDATVLDSGTGSGAWILDFAGQVPKSVAIQGIDIQSKLFPKSLPSNVTLSIGSVLSLPSDWSEKFDFVHQRLLMVALRDTEWPTALHEIMRVLKGGGWVQLTECVTWKSGDVTAKHRSLLHQLYSARGLLLNIAVDIPRLLTEAGFTSVQVEKRFTEMGKWAGQRGQMTRDSMMGAFRGQKKAILQLDGLGQFSTEAEIDEFLHSMEREWDDTEGSHVEWVTVCAQKLTAERL